MWNGECEVRKPLGGINNLKTAMNLKSVNHALALLHNCSAWSERDALARLNRCREIIMRNLCFACRGGWKRGGKRQGSELCEKCYSGENSD